MADIRFASAAKAYRELPHQLAAWNWLNEQLAHTPVLDHFAQLYRADPPIKPEASPSPGKVTSDVVHLQVPYEYQLDNGASGYRECFSSSCAMLARYWLPKQVPSDTAYNAIRARYGDTTDASAQLKALQSLGLKASFHQDGSAATLERLLRNGQPVPVGWLHRGPVTRPTGGGHWSVLIGMDAKAFYFNDPNGEADLVGGGYVSNNATAGKNIRYSRANWLPRWQVEGPGSGWYFNISKP